MVGEVRPESNLGVGALYRECFDEILKLPYYRDAAAAPPDSAAAKVVASSRHLAEHIGEAPVLIVACMDVAGVSPGITTGASIYAPRKPVDTVTYYDRWGQRPNW